VQGRFRRSPCFADKLFFYSTDDIAEPSYLCPAPCPIVVCSTVLEAMNSKHGDKLDSEVLSKLFNTVAESVRMAAGMQERWPVSQTESY